jgi:hypothetical protein
MPPLFPSLPKPTPRRELEERDFIKDKFGSEPVTSLDFLMDKSKASGAACASGNGMVVGLSKK